MQTKTIVAVSALILVGLGSGDAWADIKWRKITVGCSPEYKMYSIKCPIGESWQSCAKTFCGFKLVGSTDSEKARIMSDPTKAPRLLAPDPAAPR